MATISSIDMYNLLREKIGDQQAKTLTDFVEQRVAQSFDKEKGYLSTKQDLAEVKSDLLKWMIVLFTPFYVGMIVFLVRAIWQ